MQTLANDRVECVNERYAKQVHLTHY